MVQGWDSLAAARVATARAAIRLPGEVGDVFA